MKRLFSGIAVLLIGFSIQAAERPNVVVIYADDLGYGDTGCYGATKVQTPNIDRLAKEGRRFTDAHSASAVCSPSRYALLTGEYPFRNNMWGPMGASTKLCIDVKKLTLPRLFEQAGYNTACIGKWHLGFQDGRVDYNKPLRPGPLEIGFGYYFGIAVNNSENPFIYIENDRPYGWDANDPIVPIKNGEPPNDPSEVGRMQNNKYGGATEAHQRYDQRQTGTILSEKAVGWIKAKAQEDQPFFMYYAPPQIHHPFTPHPRFVGTSQCGMYGDFIHELDWMVGEVLDTLDELKLAENTIVIFTSDNGGMFNMGGKQAFDLGHRQNGDLLGFKFGSWEGGHRIPFIARWPGHVPAGVTSDALLCSMDLLGSMAALLGRELKPGEAVDSFNQLETMVGNPEVPVRDHLLLSPREEEGMGLRQGQWVYIGVQGDGCGQFSKQKRGGAWAVAYTQTPQSDIGPEGEVLADAPDQQLYDLGTDRSQKTNVFRAHSERAQRMKELLQQMKSRQQTRP